MLVGAVIGMAVAVSTPRSYYAAAEVLIDPRDWAVLDRDSNRGFFQADAMLALIENQTRVLTSRPVLEEVIDRLNLASDPEFNGQESAGLSPFALFGTLRQLVSLSGSEGAATDHRHALAIGNLGRALTVQRAGRTFVVNVGVSTRSPDKSALIANTVVEAYRDASARLQAGSTGRAADELTSRLDELRAGLEQAERAVETFKAENEIIDAQGRLITDDEITRLNEQLSQAKARTGELRARADSARTLDVGAVVAGSLPEQIASGSMTELRAQYNNLQLAAERLSIRLGPRHPELVAAQAQLRGAEQQIQTELSRIVSSLQVDLRRAEQHEEQLAAELARLKVRQGDLGGELVTLRELEREASAKRAVYEAFLLRARETGEQRELNTANISIISEATPPMLPSGVSRAVVSAGGIALGFLFGVGIAGARGAYRGFRGAPPAVLAESPEPDRASPARAQREETYRARAPAAPLVDRAAGHPEQFADIRHDHDRSPGSGYREAYEEPYAAPEPRGAYRSAERHPVDYRGRHDPMPARHLNDAYRRMPDPYPDAFGGDHGPHPEPGLHDREFDMPDRRYRDWHDDGYDTQASDRVRGVEEFVEPPPSADEDDLHHIRQGLRDCRAAIEQLSRRRAGRDQFGT